MNFAVNMERFASSLSPYVQSFKNAAALLCEHGSRAHDVSFVALKTMPKDPLLCAAVVGALAHISSQAAFNRGYVEGSLKNRSISCLLIGASASAIFAFQVACRVQLVFVILFSCAIAGTLEALSGSKPDLLYRELEETKRDLERKDQEITILKMPSQTRSTPIKVPEVTAEELRRLQTIAEQHEQMLRDREDLIAVINRLEAALNLVEEKNEDINAKFIAIHIQHEKLILNLNKALAAADEANTQRADVQTLLDKAYTLLDKAYIENSTLAGKIRDQEIQLKQALSCRGSGVEQIATPVRKKLQVKQTQIETLQQTLAAQKRELDEFHASALDELLNADGRLSIARDSFSDEAIAWDKERTSLQRSIVELKQFVQILEKEVQQQNAKTQILELALKMCAEKFAEEARSGGETTPINALQMLSNCYTDVSAAFADETEFVVHEGGQVALQATPAKSAGDRRLTYSVASPLLSVRERVNLPPGTPEQFGAPGELSPMGNGDSDGRRQTYTVVPIPLNLPAASNGGEA